MAEKRIFSRSRRFYILSGTLLLIIIGGFIFWTIFKYKLVNKKLDKLVTEKSKGLYQVTYDHLFIDEALGDLSVENVTMVPDSLVYLSQVRQQTAPDNLFFIHIPKLIITGVKTPKALLNKEISGHIVRIQNAAIEIRLGKTDKKKKTGILKQMGPDIYQQLLGNLKSINADSVILENASLILRDNQSKSIRCKATGLSFRFAGIAIDSLKQDDSTSILFSKELAIHCDQLELPTKTKVYSLEVSGFDLSSVTGNIHTNQIKLIPHLSETAFSRSYKYAKDRFNIRIGSMDIRHLDRQAYLQEQLVAESIEIRNASFLIFRDKSIPHDSVDRTRDYPQDAIRRLPFPVSIKKIYVKDSYIEYKEKNEKSDSSGKVAFFHVQAVFENVTNMPTHIRQNNLMRLHFESAFLNEAHFKADIKMPLNDREGKFQLDASLGPINASSLNPLVKPMALAELKKGKINGLRYHLDATHTKGKGRLTLTYEGLSIKLLKKDDDKNKYKTKVLPTLAAGFLLKDSNPTDGKLRIGTVDYNRDIHRSIFNLMWKSLFSGIKQVAL